MKKTLIALAAVAAATGAMAQATISGVLDIAVSNSGKTTTTTTGGNTQSTVKTSNTSGVAGSWATSELRVAGTEDLGGGLKASFQLNSDLRNSPAFVSRDRWVQLSGNFGSIRIGSQGNVGNSAGFNAYTQTGTTGTGSTYGLAIQGGIERQNNVINYTSPNFNGFTVMAGIARNSSDSSAADSKTETSQNGLSVTYASGPLSVGAGTTTRKEKGEALPARVAFINNTTGVLGYAATLPSSGVTAEPDLDLAAVAATSTKVKANFIGASYNLGVATIGAAIINNKATNELTGANTRDLGFNVIGVTVPMGAFTLRASTYRGDDKVSSAATDDQKVSGHQLSVTYALSKRTLAYAYTGENKTKRAGGNPTTGTVAKTTGTHIGIAHSF